MNHVDHLACGESGFSCLDMSGHVQLHTPSSPSVPGAVVGYVL